ncbi:MAG: hypothetical protein ACLFU0_00190 [Alphaproteobacteria bacterium]
MSAGEPTDEVRARRLILAASGVLRAAEPGDAEWQIRVHELARLLERAARVDATAPMGDLVDTPPPLTGAAGRR